MPLLRGIAAAVGRGALDRRRFRLRLLGSVSLGSICLANARTLGIAEIVEFVPRVTREESLRRDEVGLGALLDPDRHDDVDSGQSLRVSRRRRPVLALSEEGETADLVRASGLGVSVRPTRRLERIEAALLEVVALAGRPFGCTPAAHRSTTGASTRGPRVGCCMRSCP
jgi:hypothetical protein